MKRWTAAGVGVVLLLALLLRTGDSRPKVGEGADEEMRLVTQSHEPEPVSSATDGESADSALRQNGSGEAGDVISAEAYAPGTMAWASALIYRDGISSRESITEVWEWLKENPASPEYDAVLNEVMMTRPVELLPELMATFPGWKEERQAAVLRSMGAMMELLANPEEGDDKDYVEGCRRELEEFLATEALKITEKSGSAYDALLGSTMSRNKTSRETRLRVFERFGQLRADECRVIYADLDAEENASLFWSKQLVEYALGMHEDQAMALERVLRWLPEMSAGCQQSVAEALSQEMEKHAELISLGQEGTETAIDTRLTPEGLELLQLHRPQLQRRPTGN